MTKRILITILFVVMFISGCNEWEKDVLENGI